MIPPLIYLEDSDNEESLIYPPSEKPTSEPRPLREKYNEEPTSEPDYDAISEPSAPTKGDSIGHLAPKDIVI